MKETCSILALHEDTATRQAAVEFCDDLVQRFWAKCGFDVTWLTQEDLADGDKARAAAEKAREADIIVCALHPEGDLHWSVRSWIDSWIDRRDEREGSLVGLLDPAAHGAESSRNYLQLREVAHRAGLDYLTQAPQCIIDQIPNSLESYSQRATETTSVLTGILERRSTPLMDWR